MGKKQMMGAYQIVDIHIRIVRTGVDILLPSAAER